MTVNCGSPDLDSGWMAAATVWGARETVCKHIWAFFGLSKNSHSRTLMIKNGIILSVNPISSDFPGDNDEEIDQ